MPRISKAVLKERHDEVFAEVVANTRSPKQAIIAAEPGLKDKPGYAALKGHRMMNRPDVVERIDRKLEKMSILALKQLPRLITSDNEQIATANVWKAIEHKIGTPVKRNLNLSATVNIEDVLFADEQM